MYLSLTLYGKQRNFPRTKRQRRFRELSTDETTEKKTQNKNRKCHTGSDKTAKLLLIIIIIIIIFIIIIIIMYSKVSLWI